MATINTKRNLVFIHGPEPGHDVFVLTFFAPRDGSNLYKRLSVQPISQWQAVVDWAVGQADMMAGPLRVAAIGIADFNHFYGDHMERALATMSNADQATLRQDIVTTCAEALRECADYRVRAEAYDVLVKLGVFLCDDRPGNAHREQALHGPL